jgi:hypothetical protein
MPRPREFKMTTRHSNDHDGRRTTRNHSTLRLVFPQRRASYTSQHCDAVFVLDIALMKRLVVVGACYIDTILRSVHDRCS